MIGYSHLFMVYCYFLQNFFMFIKVFEFTVDLYSNDEIYWELHIQ